MKTLNAYQTHKQITNIQSVVALPDSNYNRNVGDLNNVFTMKSLQTRSSSLVPRVGGVVNKANNLNSTQFLP